MSRLILKSIDYYINVNKKANDQSYFLKKLNILELLILSADLANVRVLNQG